VNVVQRPGETGAVSRDDGVSGRADLAGAGPQTKAPFENLVTHPAEQGGFDSNSGDAHTGHVAAGALCRSIGWRWVRYDARLFCCRCRTAPDEQSRRHTDHCNDADCDNR